MQKALFVFIRADRCRGFKNLQFMVMQYVKMLSNLYLSGLSKLYGDQKDKNGWKVIQGHV